MAKAFALATLFQRVTMSTAESAVLQAILTRSDIYGRNARVSVAALGAIAHYCERSVQYALQGLEQKRLVHVERRVLWPGHNAINVYHVIVPWRVDPLARTRALPYWYKPNNKGAKRVHPHIIGGKNRAVAPQEPTTLGLTQAQAEARLRHFGMDPTSDHYQDCLAHLMTPKKE
jgi:hypothetical protein